MDGAIVEITYSSPGPGLGLRDSQISLFIFQPRGEAGHQHTDVINRKDPTQDFCWRSRNLVEEQHTSGDQNDTGCYQMTPG